MSKLNDKTKFIRLYNYDVEFIVNVNHIIRVTYDYIYLTNGKVKINKYTYERIKDFIFGEEDDNE